MFRIFNLRSNLPTVEADVQPIPLKGLLLPSCLHRLQSCTFGKEIGDIGKLDDSCLPIPL
jgi:hypothetical protein